MIRFIVIYVHDDQHDNTLPFCTGTLCTEAVSNFIDENFIFYVANLTNDRKAQDIFFEKLGITSMPFLSLVSAVGGGLSVLDVMQGLISGDELIARLMNAQETHNHLLESARVRAQERQLVAEQDAAYKEALEQDKEKEILAQQQQQKEELERIIALSLEQEKKEQRQRRAKRVPPEPEASNNATLIIFRMADGSKIQRRFLKTEKLLVLFDYLDSLGGELTANDIRLSTNYPKRDLIDTDKTLEVFGLHPQCIVFVQPVDKS